MKKLLLPVVIAIIVVFMFFSGLLTYRGLCGFATKRGVIGKEWSCSCFGKKETKVVEYSERHYCTGINLSYNRLMGLLSGNLQHPVYKTESF